MYAEVDKREGDKGEAGSKFTVGLDRRIKKKLYDKDKWAMY